MKLKQMYETMDLDDQVIAIPLGDREDGYHGVVKLNETGAFIFNLLRKEISEEEIIQAVQREYNAQVEKVCDDVRECIEALQSKGLLED